ncbi:MAG: NUDIX hydrolase [Longimicrobiales bacterium]
MTERSKKRTGRGRGRAGAARIETSAGGVVYRATPDGARFLLIRDPYGNWGLPKGHVEADETPADTAVREVAEETGLGGVHVRAELPCIDWFFRDRGRLIHKYCHFFLMESSDGEPRPAANEGISACVWLPFEDALETITYDNARAVLREAGRVLELSSSSATSS